MVLDQFLCRQSLSYPMALAAPQSAAACSEQLSIPTSQSENALKAVETHAFRPRRASPS
jgi:hypothetical protein